MTIPTTARSSVGIDLGELSVIAEELGVTRRTVYLALERHGIDVTRSPWINRGYVRQLPTRHRRRLGSWGFTGHW